jgi:hypothetical protein
MTLTRRHLIDGVATASGLLILILALAISDQRLGHGLTSGGAAAIGQEVGYLSVGVALMAAEVVRGAVVEHMHMAVFTVTALALVVFLMRL